MVPRVSRAAPGYAKRVSRQSGPTTRMNCLGFVRDIYREDDMKKSIAFAFLALTIAYMSAAHGARQKVNAQSPDAMPTLDQLLENYVEAIGGKAAIGRITSRVSKGTFQLSGFGAKGVVELYEKAPNKSLLIVTIPGIATMQEGFNGAIAWEMQPGDSTLRDKIGGKLAEAQREGDFYK